MKATGSQRASMTAVVPLKTGMITSAFSPAIQKAGLIPSVTSSGVSPIITSATFAAV